MAIVDYYRTEEIFMIIHVSKIPQWEHGNHPAACVVVVLPQTDQHFTYHVILFSSRGSSQCDFICLEASESQQGCAELKALINSNILHKTAVQGADPGTTRDVGAARVINH